MVFHVTAQCGSVLLVLLTCVHDHKNFPQKQEEIMTADKESLENAFSAGNVVNAVKWGWKYVLISVKEFKSLNGVNNVNMHTIEM